MTNILGQSVLTAEKLAIWAQQSGKFPASPWPDWLTVATHYIEEGNAEGVAGDIAFFQMARETALLQFGGDVQPSQYNPAGLGSTGGGAQGASFPDDRTGIRAHLQHLGGYAGKQPTQANVDQRWDAAFVHAGKFGTRKTWEGPDHWWAEPGVGYGPSIAAQWQQVVQSSGGTVTPPSPPTTPAPLQVDADGKLVSPDGHFSITYNDPWPTQNGNWNFQEPSFGGVMHTEVGYEHSVIEEFNNPGAQASSFVSISGGFGSSGFEKRLGSAIRAFHSLAANEPLPDGHIHQYGPIGKGFMYWTQSQGNPNWLGTEHEDGGNPSNPLTVNQIEATAAVFEAESNLSGWPIQATDDPNNGRGVIFHSDGGAAWGGHNCLPLDSTDVLTPDGWKRLADVTLSDLVASWSADSGLIGFYHPLAIIEPYLSPTVRVHWIEATASHRFYARQDGSRPYKAKEAAALRINDRLPLAGQYASMGLPLTSDWVRLLVHVEADGSFMRKGDDPCYGVEWHYSRRRKIARLEDLLHRLGIDFTRCDQSDGTVKLRVYGVAFAEEIALWLPNKRFGWALLEMSDEQFAAFDEEVMLADGSVSRQLYRSKVESRDFVQALYHLHGRRANVEGQGGLQMTKSADWRRRPATMCFYRKAPEPGRDSTLVGCLTTETDTLLIRQGGKVAIVGNCPGDVRRGQRPDVLNKMAEFRATRNGQPVPQPPQPPVLPFIPSGGDPDVAGKQLVNITTDAQGNGDIPLDGQAGRPLIPWAKFFGLFSNAADPETIHTHIPMGDIGACDFGGNAKIVIESAVVSATDAVWVVVGV